MLKYCPIIVVATALAVDCLFASSALPRIVATGIASATVPTRNSDRSTRPLAQPIGSCEDFGRERGNAQVNKRRDTHDREVRQVPVEVEGRRA